MLIFGPNIGYFSAPVVSRALSDRPGQNANPQNRPDLPILPPALRFSVGLLSRYPGMYLLISFFFFSIEHALRERGVCLFRLYLEQHWAPARHSINTR